MLEEIVWGFDEKWGSDTEYRGKDVCVYETTRRLRSSATPPTACSLENRSVETQSYGRRTEQLPPVVNRTSKSSGRSLSLVADHSHDPARMLSDVNYYCLSDWEAL
ncbi:hypothetical protein QBC45DRAFT_416300 [Copromyces sp. CBS 386.78]|nr:hypothetical protein QBC45DRAFT_416300 [Copromyces sp. CBS 386.78]